MLIIKEEDKEEENNNSVFVKIIPVLICGLLIASIVGFLYYINIVHFDDCVKECRSDIDKMNVSDEYRQGWIDCLKHLRVIWNSGQNATAPYI